MVTESIADVTDDAIVTSEKKRYLVDVIIYATGFEPAKSICSFRTEGKHGAVLYDQVRLKPCSDQSDSATTCI